MGRSSRERRNRREMAAGVLAVSVRQLLHRMQLFELDIPQPVKDQADRVRHTLTVYEAADRALTEPLIRSVF